MNRVTGRDLIIAGVAVIVSSLAVFVFGRRITATHALIILLSVLM